MKTDLDFKNFSLFGPVVFRPDFAQQNINITQAWSLFFTAGREDKSLGFNLELGFFFTYALIALSASGIIYSLLFRPIYF